MVSLDKPLRAILPPDLPSAGPGNGGMLEGSQYYKLEIWVPPSRCGMWSSTKRKVLLANSHGDAYVCCASGIGAPASRPSRASSFDSFGSAAMTSRLKRKLNDLGVDTFSSKANESFCLVSRSPSALERPTVNQLPR